MGEWRFDALSGSLDLKAIFKARMQSGADTGFLKGPSTHHLFNAFKK